MMNPPIGNDAGWHLHFFRSRELGKSDDVLSIGAGDYYAAIDATLPSGLAGGSYHFAVEGITNSDYAKLHAAWNVPSAPLYVDLYLFWRDQAGVLGYLASIAGLSDVLGTPRLPDSSARVARLTVTKLSRRVGTRRYEAVIDAREYVFDALRKRPQRALGASRDAVDAAVQLARAVLAEGEVVPSPDPATPPNANAPAVEVSSSQPATRSLATLEAAMVAQSHKGGRGMYLIRDGKLLVGPGRPMTPIIPLDAAGGLAHIETAAVSRDEDAESEDAPGPANATAARVQYSLTLKGRPDLRPGDVVSFDDPFANGADPAAALDAVSTPSNFGAALAGLGKSLVGITSTPALTKTSLYVSSVNHKLSRSDGFVTTLTGVSVQPGSEWDETNPENATRTPDPDSTPHAEVATAIQDLVRAAQPSALTVGEVRAAHVSNQNGASSEPPSQTVDVWVGPVSGDGQPFRARRLAIEPATPSASSRVSGMPYATPFAWGKCGLVLPRYPGTRVLVDYAGAALDDPIAVGSLWESGHGPDSQPGDYWLILPAAVQTAARQALEDGQKPDEPAEQATNDLTDADGARVIEVGRFCVRVLPSQLKPPGDRPALPEDAAEQVVIEHESGSRIVIKDSGEIVIHSEQNLTLSSKQTMTLEADQLDVKVTKNMDVS